MKETIVILLLGLMAAGLGLGILSMDVSRDAELEWLFLQTAPVGAYDAGMLRLEGIDYSVAFTDRPSRNVAHITNDHFMRLWELGADSFADDPPNAALTYEIDKRPGRAVVQLTSIDVEETQIRYAVDVLDGEIPQAAFDRITLVIDPLGMIFPSDQNGHSNGNNDSN